MLVIHKFGPLGAAEVELEFSKLVHFGEQDGKLFIWAEVNKENSAYNKKRNFLVVGTGWDYEHEFTHKASVVDGNGYVWHLLQECCVEELANRLFNR